MTMQRVKNPAYKDKSLKVGSKSYTADEQGVFDVPTDVATLLLSMKGFFQPRITKEVKEAEGELRVARRLFAKAEERLDTATRQLQLAQLAADQGQGTELGAPEKAVEPEEDPEEDEELPEDEEGSEDEEEADEEDEDEDEGEGELPEDIAAEMKAAGKGEEPSMRWSLDGLIRYCNAIGIEADSAWSKSDCVREIEAQED